MNVFLVAAGGALGGIGRYLFSRVPRGTLIANVVACFLLGLSTRFDDTQALFLGAGIAGALSTWSTFAGELADLIEAKRYGWAGGYFVSSVVLGSLALWVGLVL